MPYVQPLLKARLAPATADAFLRLLVIAERCLADAYNEGLLDHQVSLGDDAQLYGFKVWKRLRFAFMQAAVDDDEIRFVEVNGAYHLAVGPLCIRVDSLGHTADEDVLCAFPDASPAKQAVGRSNAAQLRFEMPEVELAPDESAFRLNKLTIGHFGNAREGLVKWYVGAWIELDHGGRTWAWIDRQDERGSAVEKLPATKPIVPFDQRTAHAVTVQPRRTA